MKYIIDMTIILIGALIVAVGYHFIGEGCALAIIGGWTLHGATK
jgi:hypothetical protein